MTINKNERGGMPPAGFERAAVISVGATGASWIALFLANGLWVRVVALDEGIREELRSTVQHALAELKTLGLRSKDAESRLSFVTDLASAVRNAHVILQNGHDSLEITRQLWVEVERIVNQDALLLSSNLDVPASAQAAQMAAADRVLIGSSPAAPHLLASVEVVASPDADERVVRRAAAFYRTLGKLPVIVHEPRRLA